MRHAAWPVGIWPEPCPTCGAKIDSVMMYHGSRRDPLTELPEAPVMTVLPCSHVVSQITIHAAMHSPGASHGLAMVMA